MKKRRHLPVLVLLFLPSIASAQALIASDIDILLSSWSGIKPVIEDHPRNDRHWKKYAAAIEAMENATYALLLDEDEDETVVFAEFTRRHNQLLNARAPRELAEYFQSIGWGQQGNKKFWTIGTGVFFLLIQKGEIPISRQENGSPREYLLLEKIISRIDPADMRIIESRLDDLAAVVFSS